MKKSYPKSSSTPITFRCTKQFKADLEIASREFHLNQSEIIRIGTEFVMYMLNHPDANEKIEGLIHELRQQIELRKEAAARLSAAARDASATVSTIERCDDSMRNIFRLNKPFNDVDGFRVTIVHAKYKFEQIYHDKEYGGFEAALLAAKTVRDYVSEQLYIRPEQFKEIYAEAHALLPPPYPSRKRRISSFIETGQSSFYLC